MAFSRSERRHHYARLVQKHYRENKRGAITQYDPDDTWNLNNARRRATTGKLCGCWMCRSPRALKGNGRDALTRPELIAIADLRNYRNEE